MKTHTVKAGDITHEWYLVDATDKPLGRLACEVAKVLRGKHRAEFARATPYLLRFNPGETPKKV